MERQSILIVDDEESMCRFLTVLLEKEGYRVVSSTTGRAALSLLDEETFDVVITDLRMPDMDGIQVLEGIKGKCPSVPVVILTAHASTPSAIEALNKALAGEGGRNIVKMEYARKLKGIAITGKPFSIESNIERFEHLKDAAATTGREMK